MKRSQVAKEIVKWLKDMENDPSTFHLSEEDAISLLITKIEEYMLPRSSSWEAPQWEPEDET